MVQVKCCVRILTSRPHMSNVPIIIVTAELGEEIRAAAMDAKASYFLTKPARAPELISLLGQFLD